MCRWCKSNQGFWTSTQLIIQRAFSKLKSKVAEIMRLVFEALPIQSTSLVGTLWRRDSQLCVWPERAFTFLARPLPGKQGIFIISNLPRQKTDTNTILASHGVMSSLVKLFSVKFHSPHSLALLVKLVAEELWFWGIYGMSSDIGLHRHPSQPQRYYWPRLWRKMYRPPSRCFTAASKRFLCCKVLTAGLTFLSIKNFGGDHQF